MRYFLSKSITLKRIKYIDGTRSVYSATGTASYSASIQEPNPTRAQFYNGQIGNLWECYVEEDCPAIEGDQVVHSGTKYSVQTLKTMDFGAQHYKRLTVVKYD